MDTGILQYVPREIRELISRQGAVLDDILDEKFTAEEVNWLLDLEHDIYVTFVSKEDFGGEGSCDVICYDLLEGKSLTRSSIHVDYGHRFTDPVTSQPITEEDEDYLVSRLCECSTYVEEVDTLGYEIRDFYTNVAAKMMLLDVWSMFALLKHRAELRGFPDAARVAADKTATYLNDVTYDLRDRKTVLEMYLAGSVRSMELNIQIVTPIGLYDEDFTLRAKERRATYLAAIKESLEAMQ